MKIISYFAFKFAQNSSKDAIRRIQFLLTQLKEREIELMQDRKSDRELAMELKRKRALGQIDDERLIYQYSQLQAIQYQTNQQAVEFFQQAQQALRYDRKSDLDYSLDQLERALGV